jgi:hypothetical protein
MNARALARWMLLVLLFAADRGLAQCETWMQGPLDDGTLQNGSDGVIRAVVRWDPDGEGPLQERLVVGGTFDSIGGVSTRNVAYYDPGLDQWVPFGIGIGATVYALTVFNGQVVAGCAGDDNGGTFDGTVRRWNGSTWESLSATNTGSVWALTVHDGVLFAGGDFRSNFVFEQGNPAERIAAYHPPTDQWINMPSAEFSADQDGKVRALASYAGELYIGGSVGSTM